MLTFATHAAGDMWNTCTYLGGKAQSTQHGPFPILPYSNISSHGLTADEHSDLQTDASIKAFVVNKKMFLKAWQY